MDGRPCVRGDCWDDWVGARAGDHDALVTAAAAAAGFEFEAEVGKRAKGESGGGGNGGIDPRTMRDPLRRGSD
nr:unnamed protein product [Digitaria exilis]